MKKILNFLFVLLVSFTLFSCGEESNTTTDENDDNSNGNVEGVITEKLQEFKIEIGETYNISSILEENSKISATIADDSIASIYNGVITGLAIGQTQIVLELEGKIQKIDFNVCEAGSLGATFTFDEYRLSGKNIVAFGDSVTDYATNKTDGYYELFAKHFNMNAVKNYAIGGTTAHYGYQGSNLYNEYFYNGSWIRDGQIEDGKGRLVVDGPQRVKNAYDHKNSFDKLEEVDYVFIAYSHNDQYFQPIPTHEGYDDYDVNSFESCKSFKGSYVYMINTLRKANPNVRIILLAPTYAEYDITGISYYGKEYNYEDYRTVIKEVANEYNVKYINPWNFLKDYYDFDVTTWSRKQYYNDAVHLSPKGQAELTKYLISGASDWYLSSTFTNGDNDIDWQFSNVDGKKVRLNATIGNKHLGKPIVLTNGVVKLNSDNLSSKVSGVASDSNKNILLSKAGEYVFEIDLETNDIKITFKRNPYLYYTTRNGNSSSIIKRVISDSHLYEFEVALTSGDAIQISYNGNVISSNITTITGDFNKTGESSLKTYGKFSSLFKGEFKDTDTVKFIYNGQTDTLNVNVTEIKEDDSGLTYSGATGGADYSGVATINSDGTYSFTAKLAIWGSCLVKFNGIVVSSSNTTITGDFVSQNSAPYTKQLYCDPGSPVFYSSFDGSVDYTFTYTPATETEKAKLHIDNGEVMPDGLYIETLYNDTTSQTVIGSSVTGNVATVNFVKLWGFIRFYYNGELLTTDNTTFVNVASFNEAYKTKQLYMDSNDDAYKNAQLNFSYHQEVTYNFTYDSVNKTLTVSIVE